MAKMATGGELAIHAGIVSLMISVLLPGASVAAPDGEKIFKAKCAMCHVDGGNRTNPGKPVKGSKQLNTKDMFKELLSKKNGMMPPFKAIADDDAALTALYEYCNKLK